MKENTCWLSRRLSEIGKTKMELADFLHIPYPRLSNIEKGTWNFQLKHIKKAAEFLGFDQSAFLDFLNGEISEEELYNRKRIEITETDLQLLNAFKAMAQNAPNANKDQNPSIQTPTQERER